MTFDDLRAMGPRELRVFERAHPEEVRRILAEEEARQAALPQPRRVGYWRPLRPQHEWARQDRPETIDRAWSIGLEQAERALRDLRAGVPALEVIDESDLRRAGCSSREEYLELRVARMRAAAEAEFALPVPLPGTLTTAQAEALAAWLDAGREVATYRGVSRCRVCGADAGCGELARDGFVYPSGLIHYVREHLVAVPGLEAVIAAHGAGWLDAQGRPR